MTYNPVYELRATMRTLCNDLKDRALFVDMAIKDGIERKAQPRNLPDNIYATDNDEWETYSTPSRDARIKTAFAPFYIDLQKMIDLWQQRDPRIVYDGLFLKDDLKKMYQQEAAACAITYTNSAGAEVTLDFDRHDAPALRDGFRSLSLHRIALGRGRRRRTCRLRRQRHQGALVQGRTASAQPDRPRLRPADGLHGGAAGAGARKTPASTSRRPSTSPR